MLPTVAYSDNPSTSFAAKFVHTSLNKNRCSINRVLVSSISIYFLHCIFYWICFCLFHLKACLTLVVSQQWVIRQIYFLENVTLIFMSEWYIHILCWVSLVQMFNEETSMILEIWRRKCSWCDGLCSCFYWSTCLTRIMKMQEIV